jgi:hypothetical protein
MLEYLRDEQGPSWSLIQVLKLGAGVSPEILTIAMTILWNKLILPHKCHLIKHDHHSKFVKISEAHWSLISIIKKWSLTL